MRKILMAAALAATGYATSASALPIGNLDAPNASLIQVSGGCGPYGHRGPYGRCRPGGQWGGGYGRACPPGFHLGPFGRRCRRNR